MESNSKQQYYCLDLVRGIAALIVAVGHTRALMLKPAHETNLDVIGKIIYFLTGFGYQAVMLFFVLSGFFITRSIYFSFQKNKWSLKVYVINRLSRLWVVLIPALFLTFICDYLGVTFFLDQPFYAQKLEHLELIDTEKQLTILNFLGNASFLQTLLVPTYGSNGPLWSLANEFWYYILIVLLFYVVFFQKMKRYIAIGVFMLCMTFLLYYNDGLVILFSLFLLGSLVFYLDEKYPNIRPSWWMNILAFTLFAVSLIAVRLLYIPVFYGNFLIGFFSAYTIWVLLRQKLPSSLKPIATFLSKISYTLYLIHFPFVALLTSYLGWQNMIYSWKNLGIYFILFGVVILFAYFMYYLFERNTNKVRNFILKRI